MPLGIALSTTILGVTLRMRSKPRRILIVRPSALGDVCRTVPLAWSLREAFPKATVDWVVEDRWMGAVQGHPAVDRIIEFPKREFRRWWRSVPVAVRALQWFTKLRRGRYDLVIDAQGLARSGLMALATGAATRVGHQGSREFAWLGANRRVPRHPDAHVVDAMLELVTAVGAPARADMRLEVSVAGQREWQTARERAAIRPRMLLLATTNGWEGKRWIDERWGALLHGTRAELLASGVHDVVLTGAPGEEPQTAPIADLLRQISGLRIHDMTGRLSVAATVAAVRDAALLIGLDSAPIHMAAGLGTPFVGLYGATRPWIDGPYGGAAWCVHGGAGLELDLHAHRDAGRGASVMERISVEAVAALVRRRLQSAEVAA